MSSVAHLPKPKLFFFRMGGCDTDNYHNLLPFQEAELRIERQVMQDLDYSGEVEGKSIDMRQAL